MVITTEQTIVLAVVAVLAVIIVVVGAYFTRRDDSLAVTRLDDLDKQDGNYQSFIQAAQEAEAREREQQVSAGAVLEEGRRILDPINDFLAERKFGKSWRQKLARANLKLTPAEFAVSHVVAMGGGFTLGWLILFPGDPIMSTVAAMIGFFVPRIYVSRLISSRLIAFETQLPDTLGLWVNALRSGYSVLQAMEAIARDAPEPTMTEFQRVVKEVQLGIDMSDAMQHLLERIESDDLDLVVTAVNIQREVGGNLAEILEVISSTIRERIKLKGEIRVLTSQGRITGYLISFLPIALALFLNMASPGYMGQLFESRECGWPMLGAGLTLIGIGTAVIQKIIDIEI
ncbi:MAG: type II secretion system F family protein [Anaerolineae bacterium]|jgi:tight adherence protein B|nr:type II secretion system F family protein [Anaerolineae bacterium]